MHQHGFNTHSRRSMQVNPKTRAFTSNNLPILTRDDANHLLKMEFKANEVNGHLKKVFSSVQEGLEQLGQKMPPLPMSEAFY